VIRYKGKIEWVAEFERRDQASENEEVGVYEKGLEKEITTPFSMTSCVTLTTATT
jgi:hypothetical protein